MNKTNILWISASAPSKKVPHAGGRTFNFYFKKFMGSSDFEIRLIALDDGIEKSILDKELKDIEKHIIYRYEVSKFRKLINVESEINPFNRHAGMLSNFCASEILSQVKKYKMDGYNPDVIILEWTGIVLLAREVCSIYPNSKLVASEPDVSFVGFKRKSEYYKGLRRLFWKVRFKWEKKLELRSLAKCDYILPQNPDNMDLLIREGIDKRKLQWLVPWFDNMSKLKRSPNFRDILFYGAMSRMENYLSAIWFIENVMPQLGDLDVRFIVLGGNPPEKLLKYENEKIHITGFVDEVYPYFAQSMCLVAPLVLGAGIKVKILEGLSSGIPVITNRIGTEGIPAKNGIEYIHCESSAEYVDAIRKAVTGDLEEIGRNGKLYIKNSYDMNNSAFRYMSRVKELKKET